MSVCGRYRGIAAGIVCGLIATLTFTAFGQAPQKKTPVPPVKTPVPPQKTPATPQKTPATPKTPVPPSKTPAQPGKAPVAPGKSKGAKLPEPEEVSLLTKDEVSIKATYYPSTAKKDAVPLILVHDFEGQRGDFHGLAVYLQGMGCASIAPDLRGHGQSKIMRGSGSVDLDKLPRATLEDMVYDIQACKRFLLDKNNAGELNIEQLCVVGAEYGAILAVRWSAADLLVQDLPAYKLGRDVKALVLLSIPSSFKAITIREALPVVQSAAPPLSVLFVAGADDNKASAEAKKLYNAFGAHRSKAPEDKELFLLQPPTNLSGTKLLARELDIKEKIGVFIEKRLMSRKAEFAWQDRKSPVN